MVASATTPTTWVRYGRVAPRVPGLHSFLQPTPLLLEDRIRVFVGRRDDEGRSSIHWIDVDRDRPFVVLGMSGGPFPAPVLSAGRRGRFDEHGVVPSAVVRVGEKLLLYYAGYQQCDDVRYRIYGGLAVSYDCGKSLHRFRDTPVMGPVYGETLFRVPHSIILDDDHPYYPTYQVWYGAGSRFVDGAEKQLPVYTTFYTESRNGLNFSVPGAEVLPLLPGEHRTARPSVVRTGDGYEMFFASGREDKTFELHHAVSADGITWARTGPVDIPHSRFDDEMRGYPAALQVDGRLILFYNGNDYGREGFGVAERT